MTTHTPNKLIMNLPAGSMARLLGAVSPQVAVGTGVLDGSLAAGCVR